MIPNRSWLTDAQFAKIARHLPSDTRGKARVEDKRVVSGIVHVLKSGGRWIDAPPEYGEENALQPLRPMGEPLSTKQRLSRHINDGPLPEIAATVSEPPRLGRKADPRLCARYSTPARSHPSKRSYIILTVRADRFRETETA